MNFTSDLKKELIKKSVTGDAAVAQLSAYFTVCGVFAEENNNRLAAKVDASAKEVRFFLVSETEFVAEYFTELFYGVFSDRLVVTHAAKDRRSGRSRLVLEYPKSAAPILRVLGLFDEKKGLCRGVPRAFFDSDELRAAYMRGAFFGGGSLILPSEDGKTGYHLECVFPSDGDAVDEYAAADDFCALAEESDLLFKSVRRGEEQVAYMKSKEAISDFLSVIGADNALRKFTAFCEKRERNNRLNRAANCSSFNADKTATAAVKQIMAIKKILDSGTADTLSAPLKECLDLRYAHPEMSLRELAETLGISKSCLTHRIRKIEEIAEKLP